MRIIDPYGECPPREVRIVGVVAAVKQKALDEAVGQALVYSPLATAGSSEFLITRTSLDAGALSEQIRSELATQGAILIGIGVAVGGGGRTVLVDAAGRAPARTGRHRCIHPDA